ncbi:MAG TPA: hypothetical protein VJB66_02020 [Candidatus Nanoarchaeia archaeon]|nr:hypothetical protein [Candidatus Nanoarchaeia archaeon]
MRDSYQPKSAGLYSALFLALVACNGDKPQPDKTAPDQLPPVGQLEQRVAHAAEKIDLSTPEKAVENYYAALMNPNLREGHGHYLLISQEKELRDLEKWTKATNQLKILGYKITGVEETASGFRVNTTIKCVLKEKEIEGRDGYMVKKVGDKWLLADK